MEMKLISPLVLIYTWMENYFELIACSAINTFIFFTIVFNEPKPIVFMTFCLLYNAYDFV